MGRADSGLARRRAETPSTGARWSPGAAAPRDRGGAAKREDRRVSWRGPPQGDPAGHGQGADEAEVVAAIERPQLEADLRGGLVVLRAGAFESVGVGRGDDDESGVLELAVAGNE